MELNLVKKGKKQREVVSLISLKLGRKQGSYGVTHSESHELPWATVYFKYCEG